MDRAGLLKHSFGPGSGATDATDAIDAIDAIDDE
jgi:hypothetical protein